MVYKNGAITGFPASAAIAASIIKTIMGGSRYGFDFSAASRILKKRIHDLSKIFLLK